MGKISTTPAFNSFNITNELNKSNKYAQPPQFGVFSLFPPLSPTCYFISKCFHKINGKKINKTKIIIMGTGLAQNNTQFRVECLFKCNSCMTIRIKFCFPFVFQLTTVWPLFVRWLLVISHRFLFDIFHPHKYGH